MNDTCPDRVPPPSYLWMRNEMTNNGKSAVAVIDDDPAVLDSLKFLLELAGHRVAYYGSAAAFLEDRAVGHACLILDHHMPQMTGLALAARLRSEGDMLPVLLNPEKMSASHSFSHRNTCHQLSPSGNPSIHVSYPLSSFLVYSV